MLSCYLCQYHRYNLFKIINNIQILDFSLIVSKILPSVHFGASSYALCIRNNLWVYAGHLLECIAFCFTFVTYYVRLNRSSCWQMFFKIGVFKNLAIFTRKHLCWSFFKLSRRLGGCSGLECISFLPRLKQASAAEAYSVPCQLFKMEYFIEIVSSSNAPS